MQRVGYLSAPCMAASRLKQRLQNSKSGTGQCVNVRTRHQQRAVSAPIALSKPVQTNIRVADRLGAFIAASRGTVGDLFRDLIYLLESSSRAQQTIARVPGNYAMVSARTPGMSAVDGRRVEYRNSSSPGVSPVAKMVRWWAWRRDAPRMGDSEAPRLPKRKVLD